jgi:hypothetical protein
LNVTDEDLCDVAGHQREIDRQVRKAGGIAVDLLDVLRARLGVSDSKGSAGGIDADHLDTATRQFARERSGAASDIEHRRSPQLADYRDVGIEVTPIVVHDVVQPSQARAGEDRIWHASIMDDV